MGYNSKYTGAEVDAALGLAKTALQEHQDISGKQDIISDLATIRSGAAKGATALQSIPSEYVTTSTMNTALAGKVDKVSGKGLSTNDFTTALKTKLEGLSNYDDTAVNNAIDGLHEQLDTLVSGDAATAIESFNEIIAFLDGVGDTETLEGIIASIEQQIAAKYSKPSGGIPKSDLASAVQTSLGKADTALQKHQSLDGYVKDTDLATVATSGSYGDLSNKPTIPDALADLTADSTHRTVTDTEKTAWNNKSNFSGSYNDLTNKPTIPSKLSALTDDSSHRTVTDTEKASWSAKSNFSGSYNDLTNKPTIPSAVTESTVSGWGFTKNTGTYSKPSTGIPKSDLADAVKTSLGKADTALQSYTEQYKGTITGIKMNGASKGTSGVVDLGTVITAHQDISGKQNTITDLETIRQGAAKGATALQSYTEQYRGTVTGVKVNGTTKNPSNGVVDIGTVITAHQDISGKQAKLVSGTNIKTISGQSILGSGNLTTGYGLINQGTSNTTCTLNPNTFYMWGTVSALSLSFGSAISGIVNEYTFQFTSSSSGTSLTLPSTVKWAKDEAIEIEANKIYQVSIVNNLATYLMWS